MVAVMTPPRRSVETVLAAVDKLYGDDNDENMDYHRWASARTIIDESGLAKSMHLNALTYGEFDLRLFAESLQYIRTALCDERGGERGARFEEFTGGGNFVDIGCGYGRICMTAAGFLAGWSATGIEIVHGLQVAAEEVRVEAEEMDTVCPWARNVKYIHSDYTETGGAAEEAIREADIVFCFATTWPSGGTPFLGELSGVLGRLLRSGSYVITVDKQLVTDEDVDGRGARFCRVHDLTGANRSTGESTAYIYRLLRRSD
jgi:hypothetical protein